MKNRSKQSNTSIWKSIVDILYAFVLLGVPLLTLSYRIEGMTALILVLVWAVLNYLYFRFRMKFDRGLMSVVSFIILVVALAMLCILFGSAAWDWLALRIGWFPTMLIFIVVIACLSIAVWIMG